MRRPTPVPSRALRPALALVAVATLAMAGCGDTESADTAEEGCDPGQGTTVVVEIPEFSFEPEPVAISRCDSVAWVNAHDQPHTSTGDGEQRWSTGNLAPEERSGPVRFEASGTYSYLCALHPFMTGTVEVS
ncbi:MAG: plastocyanin/azurin family copper-binding protein [Acidimicrobiia bacterium]